MSDSPGLGRPSPGQPDFDGPPVDGTQPGSNLSGWTHVAGPRDDHPATGEAQYGQSWHGQSWDGQSGPGQSWDGQSGQGQSWHGQSGSGRPVQGHDGAQPGDGQAWDGPTQPIPAPPVYNATQPMPAQPGYNATQPLPAQPSYGQAWTPPGYSQQPSQAGGPPPAWQPPATYQGPSHPPPSPQPPRRSGSSARGFILAGAVIVLLIVGLLGWPLLSPLLSGQPTPSPSPSPVSTAPSAAPSATGSPQPTVVRTSAAARPTTSTPVTGGGIGQSTSFTTEGGSGKVTVTTASWTDNGILDPQPGSAYLIVDLTFEGVSGAISTGPFFTSVTDADDETYLMSIGADLPRQLTMRTLRAGEKNTGQVAFELPKGPVTFTVRSELLEPLATIQIPG